MNVDIIVHSHTGHTMSVAEQVRDRLAAGGHTVSIEQIIPVGGDDPNAKSVTLGPLPDISRFDALVFAAPVRGMAASLVITACLSQLPPLASKKIACFVTQTFAAPWLGGNHAIAQMKKLCEAKQGRVSGTWVVNWSNKRREAQIATLVDGVGKLF